MKFKVRAVWTRRQQRCGLGKGAGVQERAAVTIEKPPSGPLGGGDVSAGPEVGGAGERVPRTVRAGREGTGRSGVALIGWHSSLILKRPAALGNSLWYLQQPGRRLLGL